ncbi:MAG: M28 family peptidase [Candidatus Aminicenantes bacterium]|nr:M28 family peptidase [Candidatus Aminicenantes bacterium]NIM78134.1 M28 family peptidase [Candidatus Aminicenantes bacterium]NIN17454.1 M28 family peptidase [Candidatus Aminicenantes bacterium]NIN41350.1 M28 family peptidase [Candidatus Aminicenantes bacterium]NIN84120.1 M28 family peptidase [Candidatus Aminicenantes bacterium]
MKRIERGYIQKASAYLETLCSVKPNRRTGSPGNREATAFFAGIVNQLGYTVDTTPFACLDFTGGQASLECKGNSFEINVSPYSLGCDVAAELITVSSVEELEQCRCGGKILLMKGEICREQLMPKNFVFYNPDDHKKIYALLEEKKPAGIITATEKKPELVGALYPFPLIVDGDFDIPNVYCKDTVGEKITGKSAEIFRLKIDAKRIPSTAANIIARKNPGVKDKIVLTAHIDAYENTPGASDNASGTVVLLLLAEMLWEYKGRLGVEIAALNGEDHYSAGGQMDYLNRYGSDFDSIIVAVNVDDVGYRKGNSAYSYYECPDDIKQKANTTFNDFDGIIEGEPWFKGDHMIFAQRGKAAIAFTSEKISELMANVTHTSRDIPDIIDSLKLVEVALALKNFIMQF